MKHTVLYGSARTGDYLIVAIKKSQRVPFPGRHDCRLTGACANETHRNKWVRAHGRLSPPYQCVKPAPSKGIFSREGDPNTQNLLPLWRSKRGTIAKYWFRKLKNVPLSTTVRWKNKVIRFWKTDCGEKCARQSFLSAANWTAQRKAKKVSSVVFQYI